MFAQGAVSTRVVETLTWRTQLVTDARVWAVVDAEPASRVHEFGPDPYVNGDNASNPIPVSDIEFEVDRLGGEGQGAARAVGGRRDGLPAVGGLGGVCADTGSDVSLPGM